MTTNYLFKNKARKSLVYGIGINDADYPVYLREELPSEHPGKRNRKLIWKCPFYAVWVRMLERAASPKTKKRSPSYEDATVCEEWCTFSNFKAWMEMQDWEGNELDKDLLVFGNKEYSPLKCCFIPQSVNIFLTERTSKRGNFMIGVYYKKANRKFVAQCNQLNGKQKYLGIFDTQEEAFEAWLTEKQRLAIILANDLSDRSLADALINRYKNYAEAVYS